MQLIIQLQQQLEWRLDQLQEWLQDYEEAIPNHRHMTHLISLYPGDQITPHKTPDLAKAARVSMERRTNRPDKPAGSLVNLMLELGQFLMCFYDGVFDLTINIRSALARNLCLITQLFKLVDALAYRCFI
jgi:hypothetical protein